MWYSRPMYKVFEIQNIRTNVKKGAITLEDGFWSADTESAQNILKSASRHGATDEEKINFLSKYVNQNIYIGLVVDE